MYSKSDAWREESRIRAADILENNPQTKQTKPQKLINDLLDNMGISYQNEKAFMYYNVDNYLLDNNLIIEVMGDFWHGNPTVVTNYEELKDIPKQRVIKDKAKRSFFKNNYNIDILYLWESDIYRNIDVCKKLIQEYISHNGNIDNYNSFNYHIENYELLLNKNIIRTYFE